MLSLMISKRKNSKLTVFRLISSNDLLVKPNLSDIEVMNRLRQRKEPIMLFAEEPLERFIRLKNLEEKEPMEYAQGTQNETLSVINNLEGVDKESNTLLKEQKEKEEKEFFKNLKKLPVTPQIEVIFYFHV